MRLFNLVYLSSFLVTLSLTTYTLVLHIEAPKFSMAPCSLTGKTLIQQRIPDLLSTDHHTTSDSTHKLGFVSTLGYWSRFERDARQHFLSVNWNSTILDYAPDDHDDNPYHVKNEQLFCGDEHSVVARFGQNVGHVMTSVIRACKGADIRFGDFKSAVPQSGFTKVPDIAVMDSKARLLLVGEAKTPWMHDIEGSVQEAPGDFRKYLGISVGLNEYYALPIYQSADILPLLRPDSQIHVPDPEQVWFPDNLRTDDLFETG